MPASLCTSASSLRGGRPALLCLSDPHPGIDLIFVILIGLDLMRTIMHAIVLTLTGLIMRKIADLFSVDGTSANLRRAISLLTLFVS